MMRSVKNMVWYRKASRRNEERKYKDYLNRKDESLQYHLSVGTEVSAKYRGAFCEAKIKTVKKVVIFRVSNKKDGKTYPMSEDSIKGVLKVGNAVEAQFNEATGWSDGIIMSARDKSVYTVEFDDGDVRTLSRGSLCLQGVRHFAESETLDHLPLTDPENFGTPVLSSKRKAKRKTPQNTPNPDEEMDSDEIKSPEVKKKLLKGESKDDNEDVNFIELRKKFLSNPLMGKLVIVEPVDKRKHWYPAVYVNPLCHEDQENLSSSHAIVRSFKTGKIGKATRFEALTKSNIPAKVEPTWKDCLDDAFSWSEKGVIPDVWKIDIKDIMEEEEIKKDNNNKDEKRDSFLEQLYKFMEDRGNPVNKTPVLGYKDLNLYLLYNLVQAKGGFHNITLSPDWREIYGELGIPKVTAAAGHHVKMAYTKYLLKYEEYLMSFTNLKPEKVVQPKVKQRRNSGRLTPTLEESDGLLRRTSRRRRVSETVATDNDQEATPPPIKRGRKSKFELETKQRDSDLDDASSTASSEKSTARGRLSSESTKSQKINDRRRSNSGTVNRKKAPVYKIGDKLKIKYGRDSFKLYNAKVVDVDQDEGKEVQYYVHYAGWNSRHDEWIKSWQVSSCVNDSESPMSNSPAPGRSRRPRTPIDDPKNNESSQLKNVSQALNFNTPPKTSDKEDNEKNATTKGRIRRRSTSSSTPNIPESSSKEKRALSEEKILEEEKSEPVKSEEVTTETGRVTPPLVTTAVLASRRMSSRRSKSPAYLRESSVYSMTKRNRTTSTASTNETTETTNNDSEATTTTETTNVTPPSKSGRVSPLVNVPVEDPKPPKNKRSKSSDDSNPEIKDEPTNSTPLSSPPSLYGVETSIILDKIPKHSLAAKIKTTCLNTPPLSTDNKKQKQSVEKQEEKTEKKDEIKPSIISEDVKTLSPQENPKSNDAKSTSDDEVKVEPIEELEEKGDSPNGESPKPESPARDDEQDEIVPPIEMEEDLPLPMPQDAPSSSKVLIENTPPTTPEGSPEHYYEDIGSDHHPPCDSGASSMSGEAPPSGSSPDYPQNSGVNEEVGEKKMKSKKQKRTNSKSKSNLESESEDDGRSKRRKSGRRRSKKPEPPSAPTPVICEDLARMDPDERIRVLQAHLTEMRTVYQQLKQEVLSIDRKRKRAKKRENEVSGTPSKRSGLPNKTNLGENPSSSSTNVGNPALEAKS